MKRFVLISFLLSFLMAASLSADVEPTAQAAPPPTPAESDDALGIKECGYPYVGRICRPCEDLLEQCTASGGFWDYGRCFCS